MRLIDADAFIEYLGLDVENARERRIRKVGCRMSRTNFNQFIYGRQNGKFAGSKKKKRRIKRGK